jgi:hypothetical protein
VEALFPYFAKPLRPNLPENSEKFGKYFAKQLFRHLFYTQIKRQASPSYIFCSFLMLKKPLENQKMYGFLIFFSLIIVKNIFHPLSATF